MLDSQLLKKQKMEKEYHDRKYKDDAESTTRYTTDRAYKFYRELVGDVNGLRVLDYGCGNGWLSIRFAKSGAKVWGIDISEELISKASKWAKSEGLSENITFKEMAAENLSFQDEHFDLIIGSAILHHTDIGIAIENINRVLTSGGRALFIEPMNQNIALKIWRKLTPLRRSPTEKALDHNDLKLIQQTFLNARYTFFSFTSIFTEGLILVFPKNKFIIFLNYLMEKLDNLVLRLFPSLGKYCAVVVMELNKI